MAQEKLWNTAKTSMWEYRRALPQEEGRLVIKAMQRTFSPQLAEGKVECKAEEMEKVNRDAKRRKQQWEKRSTERGKGRGEQETALFRFPSLNPRG